MRRLLDGTNSNSFERWLLEGATRDHPTSVVTAQMRSGLGLSATLLAARTSSLPAGKLTLLALSFGALMGLHTASGRPTQQYISVQGSVSAVVGSGLGDTPSQLTQTTFDLNAETYGSQNAAPSIGTDVGLGAHNSQKPTRARERANVANRSRSSNGSDLREEIRLLDLARNAVKNYKPVDALASLDTYAGRFSSGGAFRQEASILRMQALAQRGDSERASSIAKQFVESNPNSPYVRRAARIAESSTLADSH
jgi:pimeloyl-ACP methyl ester carboxylesterase